MILIFLACSTGSIGLPGQDDSAGATSDPSADPLPGEIKDTGPDDSDTGDTGAEPESPWDKDEFGCSTLFDQDRLVVYEATLDDADWRHLQREWRTSDGTKDYVPTTAFTVDGVAVPNAELRLKGNSSCCWAGDKMQFVVSFNNVDADARVEGERKIALDSPYYDPSVLKNRIANWYLLRQGLAGDCTNSALLYVNGEFFGLYANMEELDREFLERNFGKDNVDGDLWKYGTVLDNHEDEPVDQTRIQDFWSTYDPAVTTAMGDEDEWITEWASEAILPDGDGYWCCGHNYYLYDHPTRGFLWIPWDMDGTFDWVGYDVAPDTLWYPTYTAHMAAILGTEEGHAAYVAKVAELTPSYGSPEMLDFIDTVVAQTEAWGSIDPYRYYDDATYELAIANLRPYVESRRAYLDAWLAAQ